MNRNSETFIHSFIHSFSFIHSNLVPKLNKATCIKVKLRARCPSIFSSVAIELNVPRDDFSCAIELTFVILGHGFKKSRFSPLWYLCAWDTRYLHTWVLLRLCIIFTIGESPRVCSVAIELHLQDGQRKLCGFLRSNCFAQEGQRALRLCSHGACF